MPYSSTSELPSGVRSKYSDRCQRAFMHAFNSVHSSTGDEGKASAAGHSAAQKCEAKSMNPNELWEMLGVDLVKDAADLDPIDRAIDFTIYTRDRAGNGLALKAWAEKVENEEDELLLAGTASSTIQDLQGDTMLPTALIDMEHDAKDNLTIFLNHHYDVPEDVAGSVRQASLVSAEMDEATGVPIYDLNFERVRIDRTNDRAVKSWRSMHGGTKLGMSIGAKIPEGGAVRNKKTGALLIAHVKLLETSIVGIPANPRSWIDAATKAYKSGPKIYPSVDLEVHELELGTSNSATITINTEVEETTEPDIEAASQEAPPSEPENDEAVATPEVVAAANDVLERTADPEITDDVRNLLTEAHNSLATVTNQLIVVDAERAAAEQRAEDAERKADEIRHDTEVVIESVANLIAQIGALPAGRTASFKAIAQAAEKQAVDWKSMGFDPEVVRMLERGSNAP